MANSEYNRIVRRGNGKMASESVMIHAAIGAALSGPEHFKKKLKELTDGW